MKYTYDFDAISEYLRTLKEGEKVVETSGCMSGMGGTIKKSQHPTNGGDHLVVSWDSPEAVKAMNGLMVTAITGGTRRPHEAHLNFKTKLKETEA